MRSAEWVKPERSMWLPAGTHGLEPGMVVQCDGKRYWILNVEDRFRIDVVPEFRFEEEIAEAEKFPALKFCFLIACLWVIWKVIF